MRTRIGTSGSIYPPWRGVFYPKGLVQRRELEFLAERLDTVEINGSFYSLQRASSYRTWAERTPDDFVFAVKGGRFVTHMKKLRGVEEALANFFASGPLALGGKLGPVLWQLPPNLGYHPERIEDFLRLLARTTAEAAALAEGHTDKVPEPATAVDEDRPLRHAMEVRHASFRDPGFVDAAAPIRGRARGRGHRRGLPVPRRCHRRPRLRPSPRRHRALRERLLGRGARPVGRHDPGLGGRGVADVRGPRRPRGTAATRSGGP